MDHMYLKAAQQKLRFATPQGNLSVEDLLDLPLQSTKENRANLDDIARQLHKIQKDEGEVASFVDDTRAQDSRAALAFAVVLDVIRIRKEENAAKVQLAANAARKQQIMALIENKRNEAFSQKTIDELEAELLKL